MSSVNPANPSGNPIIELENSPVTGSAALAEMQSVLGEAGLWTPPIPSVLVPSLRAAHWIWGTNTELSSWAVHCDPWDEHMGVLPRCLEDFGDFWMFGHRGHSSEGFRIALIVRFGPLFLFQQHGWGGNCLDRRSHEYKTSVVNFATRCWISTLSELEGHGGPVRCVVVSTDQRTELLMRPLWRPVQLGSRANQWDGLRQLAESDDAVLAIAACHLLSLLTGELVRRRRSFLKRERGGLT